MFRAMDRIYNEAQKTQHTETYADGMARTNHHERYYRTLAGILH